MDTVICTFDFMNFMLFTIKFKPTIKVKKFELHNYGFRPNRMYGNESVPIQLAQCWFPGLSISNAKI